MSSSHSSAVVGTQQSPIDIVLKDTLFAPDLGALEVKYTEESAIGKYDEADENFVVSNSDKLILTFRGKKYGLAKIHFHEQCEHKVNGKDVARYELHLVHKVIDPKKPSMDKLVLGVFFKPAKGSTRGESFKLLADALNRGGTADPKKEVTIPLKDFVPEDASRWVTYQGSLTSYPYTEDVTWVVNLSVETIDQKTVKELAGHNAEQVARPLFPLNRRFVLRNTESAT